MVISGGNEGYFFALDGRQYIAISDGAALFTFALP